MQQVVTHCVRKSSVPSNKANQQSKQRRWKCKCATFNDEINSTCIVCSEPRYPMISTITASSRIGTSSAIATSGRQTLVQPPIRNYFEHTLEQSECKKYSGCSSYRASDWIAADIPYNKAPNIGSSYNNDNGHHLSKSRPTDSPWSKCSKWFQAQFPLKHFRPWKT